MISRALLVVALVLSLAGKANALTPEEFGARRDAVADRVAARDYAAAEAEARALLAETEAAFGADALEAGQVIDLLVDARLGQRAADEECLELTERAVHIKEKAAGPEEPETAESLRRLGLVLQARQRPVDARAPLERALAIQEARFGKGSPQAAEVLPRLAFLYRDLGLESEAARRLEETLAIRDGDPTTDPGSLAPLLYNLAVMQVTLGELDAAERNYRRLLEITSGKDGRASALAWNGLGMLLIERARFVEAQDALERAIAESRGVGDDAATLAYYLNNLGYLLTEIGDLEEAVRVYGEALDLRRRVHGSEHRNTATTLSNLADAWFQLGDVRKAHDLQEEALDVLERVLGPDHAQVATSLRMLAKTLIALDRPAEARSLLRRGLDIRNKHLGGSNYYTAEMTCDWANALRATGDPAAAERAYRNGLAVLESALGRDSPSWTAAALGLARVLAERGSFDDAWDLALEAEQRSRNQVRLTAAALSERQALRYAAVSNDALSLVLALLPRRAGDPEAAATAWDRVIRSRALVLDVVAARRAAVARAGDPAVAGLLDEYTDASRRLASLWIEGPREDDAGAHAQRILEARQQREEIEQQLARRSGVFQEALARSSIGYAEVADALPPGAAIVAISRYATRDDPVGDELTDRYLAFILPPRSGAPVAVPLGTADEVDARVARWRTAVRLPGTAYRPAGSALRESIWDPVRGAVAHADLVFFVPDGALHRVSLYTLPVGTDRFLVDDDPAIQYLAAERDLARRPASARGGRGLLACGGVDFGATENVDAGGALAGVRFDPLPATGGEVREIARLWERTSHGDPAVVLTEAEATEDSFKRLAPGKRIVHLATHGFFLGEDGPRGAPGSRSIGGVSARRPAPTRELALSGLAFAGANDRGREDGPEDGVLTAEEIAALDMSGTEWVVLSACDTGLGEVQAGEGVLGLRRAFEESGVGTLVMSLWDVDDEATRHWMTTLYEARFGKHLSTVASIREACRDVREWARTRRGTDHPAAWGAFVGVGEWN